MEQPPQTETEAQRQERERDAKFNIIHHDIEDATRIYPVIRSEKRDEMGNIVEPRRVENGWMLVGEGVMPSDSTVAIGKFQRYEDGAVLTKYLRMDDQDKLLADRRAERAERRKIFKPRVGAVAVTAAGIPEAAAPFIEPENEQTKSIDEIRTFIENAQDKG